MPDCFAIVGFERKNEDEQDYSFARNMEEKTDEGDDFEFAIEDFNDKGNYTENLPAISSSGATLSIPINSKPIHSSAASPSIDIEFKTFKERVHKFRFQIYENCFDDRHPWHFPAPPRSDFIGAVTLTTYENVSPTSTFPTHMMIGIPQNNLSFSEETSFIFPNVILYEEIHVLEASIRQSFMCDVWDRLFVILRELKDGKGKDPESSDSGPNSTALAPYVFLMEHVSFP